MRAPGLAIAAAAVLAAEGAALLVFAFIELAGLGLPEGRIGQGLGTQIIRTLIQGELGGTIEWRGADGEGTEVVIDIPLRWLEP